MLSYQLHCKGFSVSEFTAIGLAMRTELATWLIIVRQHDGRVCTRIHDLSNKDAQIEVAQLTVISRYEVFGLEQQRFALGGYMASDTFLAISWPTQQMLLW